MKLHIFGSGPEKRYISNLIKSNKIINVFLHGPLQYEVLREKLFQSKFVFLSSNFREGWGVIANESLNSGSILFASYQAGSTPLLIINMKNGLIINYDDTIESSKKIQSLIKDSENMKQISRNAYFTIKNVWNEYTAVSRLLNFMKEILYNRHITEYNSGPLKKSIIIKNYDYNPKKNK
jgi:glycosyltransferase involved in cell wall biosynthesis